MVDNKDFYWLAGLLEGEGCFTVGRQHHANGKVYRQPKIQLVMTDKDIVTRVASLMGVNLTAPRRLPSGKVAYRTALYGPKCIGLSMSIYGLMGERRQQQIEHMLDVWKTNPGRGYKGGSSSQTT